jgi:hypothetical protein
MRSAANRFLIACISAQNGRPLDPSALPRGLAAWDRALRLAALNGLGPLVYDRLRGMPTRSLVPDSAWRRLQRDFYVTGFRTARLQAELGRILRAWQRENVPVIVLKGAALAETAWGSVALRPMRDIDVMVPEEAISAAELTLDALGYVKCESYRPAAWYRQHHHHLAPRLDPASGVVVEVHRNIVAPNPSFSLDPRGFGQRAQPQSIAGTEALVLSPEDTVIHLCLHTACDDPFVGKIQSVADLVQFASCQGHRLRWDEVAERSASHAIARFIHYVLEYASSEHGLAVPEPARQRIRDAAAIDPLSDRLLRWLIPLAIFRDEGRQRLVPDWRLRHACGAMLYGQGLSGRMAALVGWSREHGARSPSRPASLAASVSAMPLPLARDGARVFSSGSSLADFGRRSTRGRGTGS